MCIECILYSAYGNIGWYVDSMALREGERKKTGERET